MLGWAHRASSVGSARPTLSLCCHRVGCVAARPRRLSAVSSPAATAASSAAASAPATPSGATTSLVVGDGFSLTSRTFGHLLWELAWPERWRLGGAFALLGASTAITVSFPKAMGAVMDGCLAGGGDWTPASAAAALGVLFVAQGGMVAVRGRILAVAGERVASRLRRQTFASLLARDVAFFDSSRTGELLSRLSSDCSALQKLVVSDVVGAARGALVVVGSSTAMCLLSPPLFAVSVATFPAAVLFARRMGARTKDRQKEVQEALADASAEAERALGSIRTVKLFCAEDAASERFGERIEEARRQGEAVGAAAALSEAGVGLALQSSLLCVLAVGGQQVLDGTLSYGDLSAFMMYSVYTGFSAGTVASAFVELRRATGASERVLHLLELSTSVSTSVSPPPAVPFTFTQGGEATLMQPGVLQPAGGSASPHATGAAVMPAAAAMAAGTAAAAGEPPLHPLEPRGAVELTDVRFAYPTAMHRPVLANVSLRVHAGERVAIRGPSGCGKSTIALLLSGLYAPTGGSVRIDGVDVGEYGGRQLRTELVSVVPQEPVLLSGSLRDNVALGRPDASEGALRAAAEAAGCDFAEADWTRDVGERGLQLSGGQKQRVALARVLLRSTPIVVLDEFSSALEEQLEQKLVSSLGDALRGRTVILITHRTTALQLVDRVIDLVPAEGGGVGVASSQ